MVFTVNGVDLAPYIAKEGFQWTRNDVDGPNAGRSLDNAYMIRDRVAVKRKLNVTCRPLTTAEIKVVLNAILPEFVTVKYTDPMAGGTVTKQMYSNNVPASFLLAHRSGVDYWGGVTFPLVER